MAAAEANRPVPPPRVGVAVPPRVAVAVPPRWSVAGRAASPGPNLPTGPAAVDALVTALRAHVVRGPPGTAPGLGADPVAAAVAATSVAPSSAPGIAPSAAPSAASSSAAPGTALTAAVAGVSLMLAGEQPAVAAPLSSWAPPPGPPAALIEQLKQQMADAQGTSGKPCRFGRTCKSVTCDGTHPNGREIEDDPSSAICTFGRRCKRMNCFYVHPSGRVVDEDPSRGRCKFGEACTNPSCFYTHPDQRKPVNMVFCYLCKEQGHMRKDCPKDPQGHSSSGRVTVTNFPKEWESAGKEALAGQVAAELEVFGQLASYPEVSDDPTKAVAVFADAQIAKQAVVALNGTVFDIRLDAPPPVVRPPDARVKHCTVFVGNIPYDGTKEQLKEIFSRVGTVEEIRLVLDKDTMLPKGYGFCEYSDPEIAKDAVRFLNDAELNGRRLRVTSADNTLKSRGDIAFERRPPEAIKDEEVCRVKIEGFPQRWTSDDVRDFFHGAVVKSKSTVVKIDMVAPAEGLSVGRAFVSFASKSDARRACADLDGQKVAGKPLSISPEDGGSFGDEADDAAEGRDDQRRKIEDWRKRDEEDSGRKDDEWRKHEDSRGRKDDDKLADKLLVNLHVDELAMPGRPALEPAPTDSEVWVDPLPEEDKLQEWLSVFGEVEDVFRVPDHETGMPGDRGYVKFKDHASAGKCIAAGAGTWSESERTLSSQLARHGGRSSAYPESIVGKILGCRGETISAVKDEIGASLLSLRGEGLGDNEKMVSKRVHFVCKGSSEAVSRLQPALERAIKKIHDEVQEKLADPSYLKRSQRVRSRSPRRPEHASREHNRSGEMHPWRPPPTGDARPPPPWGPIHQPMPGYGWPREGFPWPPGPPPPWAAPWGQDPRWPPPWAPPGHPGGGDARHPPPGEFVAPGPAPEHEAPGASGSGKKRRRRHEEESEGAKRGRGRRGRRHEDEGPEPTGEDGERRRKRRRDREATAEGFGAQSPGHDRVEQPAPPASATPVPEASGWSAVGYLEKLPRELTDPEKRLGEAVAEFMRAWRETHEEGSRPNLVHLGADVHIRETKALALPREVSLKVWLKHRLSHKVDVTGQTVVLHDQAA